MCNDPRCAPSSGDIPWSESVCPSAGGAKSGARCDDCGGNQLTAPCRPDERKARMMEAGDRKTLAWIDEAAGFQWLVHPHQLRHGCGYELPNGGGDTRALQRYLGHRNIQRPTRSTELVSGRFEGWQD